ncbi:hypothetical protein NPX13_g2272 [Xylaria arbuscula]|uniref:Uncharacterized protein n=1 Tax=Xylaria arbuscula TaxID=114810 RepID=A0A9W8TPB5_9PEZI|nr:hypothetical protein NPX13_g2272 [Xylaria arbuscula]
MVLGPVIVLVSNPCSLTRPTRFDHYYAPLCNQPCNHFPRTIALLPARRHSATLGESVESVAPLRDDVAGRPQASYWTKPEIVGWQRCCALHQPPPPPILTSSMDYYNQRSFVSGFNRAIPRTVPPFQPSFRSYSRPPFQQIPHEPYRNTSNPSRDIYTFGGAGWPPYGSGCYVPGYNSMNIFGGKRFTGTSGTPEAPKRTHANLEHNGGHEQVNKRQKNEREFSTKFARVRENYSNNNLHKPAATPPVVKREYVESKGLEISDDADDEESINSPNNFRHMAIGFTRVFPWLGPDMNELTSAEEGDDYDSDTDVDWELDDDYAHQGLGEPGEAGVDSLPHNDDSNKENQGPVEPIALSLRTYESLH